MDVVALSFQLIDVRSQICNLVLKVVDLVVVRLERSVESLRQKIGQRLGLCRRWRRAIETAVALTVAIGLASVATRGRQGRRSVLAVLRCGAIGHACVFALGTLVVDGARRRRQVIVLIAVALGVLLVVRAVGLAVVAVLVVDVGLAVAPGPAKTLEEHGMAEEEEKGRGVRVLEREAGRNMGGSLVDGRARRVVIVS
jgi:hypothetical protein